MKNKILLLLLAVAIFIPSVVAIISYHATNDAPVSEKNLRSIEVADLAGNTFTFQNDGTDEEKEMLNFFMEMNEHATSVSQLPEPLVGTAFFKVTMKSSQKSADYQYYFSTEAQEAYYLDADGKAYKIRESDASEFLASRYAVSLYINAVVPSLTISGQSSVQPVSATWMYKNSANVFVECDPTLAGDSQRVEMEGGLDFAFTLQPDNFHIKLTDVATGEVVFNDQYENIHTLSIDKTVTFAVEVSAKWYEDSARDYYGELLYNFTAGVTAAAEFYLGETTIENGQFTVVSAINIADPSRITFSSSPDIGYTPTFYLDGDYAIALLPIQCSLEAGTYTLSFKYGSVVQELTLDVTQRNIRNFQYSISESILNATRNETTLAAFETAVSSVAATGVGTQYWSGTFVEAVHKNGTYDGIITTGFGHNRTILANNVTYLHEGVDYITASGASIYAVNAGKVVYTGFTELGGNTIIIEHGYGLKSWYCHLDSISVSVGDMVEKDSVIGIAGSTGFTNQTGVHAGLSVFDVPVSPYPSWDKEIKITK